MERTASSGVTQTAGPPNGLGCMAHPNRSWIFSAISASRRQANSFSSLSFPAASIAPLEGRSSTCGRDMFGGVDRMNRRRAPRWWRNVMGQAKPTGGSGRTERKPCAVCSRPIMQKPGPIRVMSLRMSSVIVGAPPLPPFHFLGRASRLEMLNLYGVPLRPPIFSQQIPHKPAVAFLRPGLGTQERDCAFEVFGPNRLWDAALPHQGVERCFIGSPIVGPAVSLANLHAGSK
jgi:hypothetical protein